MQVSTSNPHDLFPSHKKLFIVLISSDALIQSEIPQRIKVLLVMQLMQVEKKGLFSPLLDMIQQYKVFFEISDIC